jgi:hypothetical protein
MFNAMMRRSRRNGWFETRSPTRDIEKDNSRLRPLFCAIEEASASAEAEHSGLKARVEDVMVRSAMTLGNDTDEYLTRELADTKIQDEFGRQILSGQDRLRHIEVQMKAFQFMKAVFLTRFPDFTNGPRQD